MWIAYTDIKFVEDILSNENCFIIIRVYKIVLFIFRK